MALTRDLVNTPPNDLFPKIVRRRAARSWHARPGSTSRCSHEQGPQARPATAAILAVGQGSRRGPRLVRISYRPAKPRAHVALVGKGITFDSGGLNLKTAHMAWMKSDMGGAAAVIASDAGAAPR